MKSIHLQQGSMTLLGKIIVAVLITGVLLVSILGVQSLRERGFMLPKAKEAVTAEAAKGLDLPRGQLEVAPAVPTAASAPVIPTGGPLKVRLGQLTWAAEMPTHAAAGGAVTQPGSIMARRGIDLEIVKEDSYKNQTAMLMAFAKDWKAGKPVGSTSFNAVQMMGDGSPGFVKGVNEALAQFGGHGVIIYATGFSFGEDKAIGPKEWLTNPSAAKGGVVVGVRGDGDLHLWQDWANKQRGKDTPDGIRVNPNQKCWDPHGLNFVGVDEFKIGDQKFVNQESANFECTVTEDGKSVKPGKVAKPIQGTATWAPGDKWVHDNYRGTTPIVVLRSTADNIYQMPSVIIVHKEWAHQHFDQVVEMILGLSEAGDLLRSSPTALQKTCAITAKIYSDGDAKYWCDTVKGFKSTNPMVQYDLGGSRFVNLADNMLYFRAMPGSSNTFDRVYDYFGKLDMLTFPDLFEDAKGVASMPAYFDVVDTSFMKAAWAKLQGQGVALAAAVPDYDKSVSSGVAISNVSYADILFDSGKAIIKPESEAGLDRVLADLANDGGKLAVIGHTDDVGSMASNMDLSRRRAAAVTAWLSKKAPMSFPPTRFAKVEGKGPTEPPKEVNDLSIDQRRAQMRRVQIVVLRTETTFKQ